MDTRLVPGLPIVGSRQGADVSITTELLTACRPDLFTADAKRSAGDPMWVQSLLCCQSGELDAGSA